MNRSQGTAPCILHNNVPAGQGRRLQDKIWMTDYTTSAVPCAKMCLYKYARTFINLFRPNSYTLFCSFAKSSTSLLHVYPVAMSESAAWKIPLGIPRDRNTSACVRRRQPNRKSTANTENVLIFMRICASAWLLFMDR